MYCFLRYAFKICKSANFKCKCSFSDILQKFQRRIKLKPPSEHFLSTICSECMYLCILVILPKLKLHIGWDKAPPIDFPLEIIFIVICIVREKILWCIVHTPLAPAGCAWFNSWRWFEYLGWKCTQAVQGLITGKMRTHGTPSEATITNKSRPAGSFSSS
jgi:hypothetical protein